MEIKIYCYFNVKKFGWKYIFVKKLRKKKNPIFSNKKTKFITVFFIRKMFIFLSFDNFDIFNQDVTNIYNIHKMKSFHVLLTFHVIILTYFLIMFTFNKDSHLNLIFKQSIKMLLHHILFKW